MGRQRRHGWWPLWAVIGIAAVVAWVLYAVWRSRQRTDLATYGAFALPVATIVVGWIVWAWRKARTNPQYSALDSDSLDRATNQLATAVLKQWEKAAWERELTTADPIQVSWGRPSLPMTVPLTAAVGSRQFDPLPGLEPFEETQLGVARLE
jgi:hypothetical protein